MTKIYKSSNSTFAINHYGTTRYML